MSEMIAVLQHRPERNEWREGRLCFRILLGLTLGVLGFALATSSLGGVRSALSEEAAAGEAVTARPAPELPREWRWQPKGVEYEHMYRKPASPGLDWIR